MLSSDRRPAMSLGVVLFTTCLYFCLSDFFSIVIDRGIVGSMVLDGVMSLIGILFCLVWTKSETRQYEYKHVGMLFFSGFVYWLCMSYIVSYYQRLAGQWPVDIVNGFQSRNNVLYAILVLVFAPLFEESFFRGILFGWLKNRIPWIFAAFVTGCLFSLAHGTDAQVYSAFLLGIFLCVLYYHSGNLGWCVLFHSVYNLGMLFLQGQLPVPVSMDAHYALVVILSVVLLLYTTALISAVVYINKDEPSL